MKKAMILPVAAAALGVLTGCMPVPEHSATQAQAAMPTNMPTEQSVAIQPAIGITGLQERTPDLCKAETYSQYLNQPGSVIPTLGITRDYRVVEHRGIEAPEYDPNRIVFRLDAAGNISNIDCG